MQQHDIVVIGASAGGVDALRNLVCDLPADLPAACFITLHVAANSPSLLAEVLNRAGPLPATYATHREAIVPGHIYIAPPDHHLLIERDHMHVVRGPRENGFRPAIDALFRTAALAYGPRVLGVILTGMLDDGTAGLLAIPGWCPKVQNITTAFWSHLRLLKQPHRPHMPMGAMRSNA